MGTGYPDHSACMRFLPAMFWCWDPGSAGAEPGCHFFRANSVRRRKCIYQIRIRDFIPDPGYDPCWYNTGTGRNWND